MKTELKTAESKTALIPKVSSIGDLFQKAKTDPRYATLAMVSASNLGGTCSDLRGARQWLELNATEGGSEEGVVDEINFCIDFVMAEAEKNNPKGILLKIFGANLQDQSKGTFVVHEASCADCAKLEKLREHFTIESHDSALSVSGKVWADFIEEGGMTAEDGLGEIHFAPCVDFGIGKGLAPEAAAKKQSKNERIHSRGRSVSVRGRVVTASAGRASGS